MSELAPINEKDVSLFRLKSELVELMNLRENEELSTEERAAVDGQVKEYLKAELRKVDNIGAFVRHRRVMAKAAKDEAQRLAKLSASYEAEEEYILGICKDLMIHFGERKLEGERGSISLQKNGGNVGLEIPQPELLPDELVQYRGWINTTAYRILLEDCTGDVEFRLERTPKADVIREALNQGPVAGARLQDRGEHVRIK